jgi:hypothetical protein
MRRRVAGCVGLSLSIGWRISSDEEPEKVIDTVEAHMPVKPA